ELAVEARQVVGLVLQVELGLLAQDDQRAKVRELGIVTRRRGHLVLEVGQRRREKAVQRGKVAHFAKRLDRSGTLDRISELGKFMLALCFVFAAEDAHQSEAKGGDLVTSHGGFSFLSSPRFPLLHDVVDETSDDAI